MYYFKEILYNYFILWCWLRWYVYHGFNQGELIIWWITFQYNSLVQRLTLLFKKTMCSELLDKHWQSVGSDSVSHTFQWPFTPLKIIIMCMIRSHDLVASKTKLVVVVVQSVFVLLSDLQFCLLISFCSYPYFNSCLNVYWIECCLMPYFGCSLGFHFLILCY